MKLERFNCNYLSVFFIFMICQIEDQIAQPFSEIRVICILFKQFHIIGHNRQHNFLQRTVAFGSRFLFIAIAHGVFDSVHHD